MQKSKVNRLSLFAILAFLLISNFSYGQFDQSISYNESVKQQARESEVDENTEDRDNTKPAEEAFSEKGINKIVWSNVAYPSGNLSEKDNMDVLKSTLPVYGTAFLSAKLKDLLRAGGSQLFLTIKIDGAKTYLSDPYIFLTNDMLDKSYVQFTLVPSLTDSISHLVKNGNLTTKEFSELFLKKDPKVYKVTVYFEFGKTNEKIEGSFDYDITGGVELNQQVVTRLSDGLGDGVELPAAAMKNEAFESQMLALANHHAENGAKYTTCRITSPDWTIMKNDLGVIVERRLAAFLVAKYPDGHCELSKKFFRQAYAGGGKYSSQFSMQDDAYAAKRMNCGNVK